MLLLQGPGLSPLTDAAQASILKALELTWVGQSGMTDVTPRAYKSPQRKRLRMLLAGGDQVAEVVVGVTKGQAPGAAAYVESSVASGDLAAELDKQGELPWPPAAWSAHSGACCMLAITHTPIACRVQGCPG